MLTIIIDESTEMLCTGEDAEHLIEDSFGIKTENGSVVIKGMYQGKSSVLLL